MPNIINVKITFVPGIGFVAEREVNGKSLARIRLPSNIIEQGIAAGFDMENHQQKFIIDVVTGESFIEINSFIEIAEGCLLAIMEKSYNRDYDSEFCKSNNLAW